ncbi:drug resistance transporter, EmrB/QacA subfamily [Nannocystis exedens]|uniref:Drug resistance transporter, EmrB/QacA subfamily n=1 Tax=Nannocystis exedens TaxID=54 RepID=A0A1I2G0C0_9BACT|nr:DHA2 family efflux MFS transporter permease subunit [Nannocystis exedens]PCC74577.1 drug resistance transporter [Nannocystis exedens]SFF10517.1 drug resistance transporter, EmrB/QacA subfamily [Nannocystis exedens]
MEIRPSPLVVASLAVFAVFLDTTVLFVAFPSIAATFPAAPTAELSWVLNAYTIVFAAALVPFGRLADRWGHRATFLAGSVAFTLASLLCAVAPTPALLVAARVLQAAGGAALVPSSLALVMRATPREKLPVALAVWGATGAVAGAVGPTLGAALIEACGWRWVFVINLPVGLVTVLLGRRRLAESRDPDSVLPAPLGVVLLVIAAVLVTLALVLGESWGWAAPKTAATLVAGLATLAAFVIHQARTRAPTIDPSLFAAKNFRWANAATLTFGAAFTAMFLASVLFLTAVWGWSILAAGFGVAPGPLLVAALSPRFGRLAARIGQRPLLVAGGLAFALGGLWRLMMLSAEVDYAIDYLPSMLLTGTGVALCLPQLSSVVGQALPPNRLGVGGAVHQALRQFAGTLGVALAIGLTAGASGPADALARFDRVWWVMIAGGVATALCSLPLRTGPARA